MGRSLKNISLNGSRNSVALPKGTTAGQPTSAVAGMLRFNTSLNQLEYYNGTIWKQLQGGAGGSSTITRDAFTMDGSTLTYGPLSFTPTAEQNVLVFIEGVFQHDGKIFLFLGEGQHKIKRKAEQIACNEALQFLNLSVE